MVNKVEYYYIHIIILNIMINAFVIHCVNRVNLGFGVKLGFHLVL